MFLSSCKTENNLAKASHENQRVGSNFFFQPKLTVNQPNDVYEQEADAMADHVMRMPSPIVAGQQLFFKPSSIPISRLHHIYAQCEGEEQNTQRKESNNETIGATTQTENYLGSLSGGKELSKQERNFFESRMGYDFSNVRIHSDDAANESAYHMNALAYTHGNNIVFGTNQFSTENDTRKRLLAHELSHVIQHNIKTPKRFMIHRTPNAYDEGYQDGWSGNTSRAFRHHGSAFTAYSTGYSRGHRAFIQRPTAPSVLPSEPRASGQAPELILGADAFHSSWLLREHNSQGSTGFRGLHGAVEFQVLGIHPWGESLYFFHNPSFQLSASAVLDNRTQHLSFDTPQLSVGIDLIHWNVIKDVLELALLRAELSVGLGGDLLHLHNYSVGGSVEVDWRVHPNQNWHLVVSLGGTAQPNVTGDHLEGSIEGNLSIEWHGDLINLLSHFLRQFPTPP